uniref:Photosystem II reaction center protein Y n=1 Tax=Astrosyne radiata TaxID=1158023 RepID=A0A2U9NTH7_9STRA|nr:photosystem II protein Y [Astrosyne radiata]YP_009497677.1 photosystem II protein Y [Astrosyne radiata]AWT40335.1 photosystem II protein Y [Astrosyne radiata]AWT40390.1 photosystem II protein Y [Astrosyne radiata]
MDIRILIILSPLLTALAWALFNIARLAIQQLKRQIRGNNFIEKK